MCFAEMGASLPAKEANLFKLIVVSANHTFRLFLFRCLLLDVLVNFSVIRLAIWRNVKP